MLRLRKIYASFPSSISYEIRIYILYTRTVPTNPTEITPEIVIFSPFFFVALDAAGSGLIFQGTCFIELIFKHVFVRRGMGKKARQCSFHGIFTGNLGNKFVNVTYNSFLAV